MKKNAKELFRQITVICAAATGLILLLCAILSYLAPSQMHTGALDETFIAGKFPLSLRYDRQKSIHAAFDTTESAADDHTMAQLMLFGAIPVKEVDVALTERKNVLLGGMPFGIRIYTDGLVVSGLSDDGSSNLAREAGISCGDIILSVNGKKLGTNEELVKAVQTSKGHSLTVRAMHDSEEYMTEITPVYDSEQGLYRIGLMVRDSCAGIGTLTFIDTENGSFAGLGHGICDSKSGSLMPLQSGDIVKAEITSVRKSVCGTPGALSGCFSDSTPIGTIFSNSEYGVYGQITDFDKNGTMIPIAFKQEVHRGDAQILTTVDNGEPQYYSARIEDISYNNVNASKNMTIRITDKRLLEKTGGIVQGMSGSPIIQDGKLAGAVTHVFVNDPSSGHGIFTENMILSHNSIIQKHFPCAA